MQKEDYKASQKVDSFLANSKNTEERIKKLYLKSTVIYPGIDIPSRELERKEDYYIGVGRCIPYKKFDLLVDTFNTNGEKLILCTATDTPLYRVLKRKIKIKHWVEIPYIEWRKKSSHSKCSSLSFPSGRRFLTGTTRSDVNGNSSDRLWKKDELWRRLLLEKREYFSHLKHPKDWMMQ